MVEELALEGEEAPRAWPRPPAMRRWEWVLLALVVAYGVGLRAWRTSDFPLWVDEAETSINALTILQHGVPTSHYLGLPVFENTFTRLLPDSVEYEFKDSSYSDRGLAIYHGWLPLYVLAGSFALHGVAPDDMPAATPRHSADEIRRRTRAARMPALGFGVVFLVSLFFTGRQMYGADAGWAAVASGAVLTSAIVFSRQARYYSSTLALSVLCCLLICYLVRYGRWRDFLLAAMALELLFFTNVLSFLVVSAVGLLTLPFVLRHAQAGAKLAVSVALVLSAIVPWMLLSGFLTAATDRPMARELLTAGELLRYPLDRDRWPFLVIAAAALLWLFVAARLRHRFRRRVTDPFVPYARSFVFLAAWVVIACAVFIAVIPAASFFSARLTLAILGPALLFGALLFAAIARTLAPRASTIVATLAFVLVLNWGGKVTFAWPAAEVGEPPLFRVIDALRKIQFPAGSRLYTDTGDNLILRFYTAMPFQNVMPVRKSFLDSFPGRVFVLEGPPYEWLSPPEVQRELSLRGLSVTRAEAADLARATSDAVLREDLASRVARILPEGDAPSDVLETLMKAQRQKTVRGVARAVADAGNPMFDGYDIRDYTTMWQVFFFRFAAPEGRMGPNRNYEQRIRDAEAILMPSGWVLLGSKGGTVETEGREGGLEGVVQ